MTFLAALRCGQVTAPCVFDGPINGECFLLYVGGELNAVIGENRVDFARYSHHRIERKLPRYGGCCLFMKFDEREFRGSINGDEEVMLTLLRANVSNADVEVADWAALELSLRRFVAINIRYSANPVPLQTPVQ